MHDTLFSAVKDFIRQPLKNFHNLRKLTALKDMNSDDVIWALKDVSFEVKRGEVVGIIGRNGAGKSTLLKILARITEPTSGRAIVNGRMGSLLEVGTGMHPELTGRENIYLSGTILGMRKTEIDRKFDEIVEFAEIGKFIDTPIKRYSSGMKVRLGFAIAAHLEPEILLVDEVLAVGDAVFQKKCLGKMGDVAREGRTVLFVSHNMGAISNLCRSCICLDNGQIVDFGVSEKIVKGYINRISYRIADDGFADLRKQPRPVNLNAREAQFDWIKILNYNGKKASVFLEGDPIIIEVGFSLKRDFSHIQLACGIAAPDVFGELFTVPSPEYHCSLQAGSYSTKIRIEPNYLREGYYRVTLKMFADGIRQDTIADTIEFSIIRRLSRTDTAAYSQKWIHGRFRFDYDWGEIVPDTSSGYTRSVSTQKD